MANLSVTHCLVLFLLSSSLFASEDPHRFLHHFHAEGLKESKSEGSEEALKISAAIAMIFDSLSEVDRKEGFGLDWKIIESVRIKLAKTSDEATVKLSEKINECTTPKTKLKTPPAWFKKLKAKFGDAYIKKNADSIVTALLAIHFEYGESCMAPFDAIAILAEDRHLTYQATWLKKLLAIVETKDDAVKAKYVDAIKTVKDFIIDLERRPLSKILGVNFARPQELSAEVELNVAKDLRTFLAEQPDLKRPFDLVNATDLVRQL